MAGDKILLERVRGSGKVPLLSNESQGSSREESASLPGKDQDRSLAAAINDFRRVLPADGEVDEDGYPTDSAEHYRALEREAKRLNILHEGLKPEKAGGREHDVTFDPDTGTVLKFTKPNLAGYIVGFDLGDPRLEMALPMDYLRRQQLHNEIFGDYINFVGVGGDLYNRRIITRQPLVEGRPATAEEIARMMTDELGFTKLRYNYGIGYENAQSFIKDNVAVFDLRPANVFVDEQGNVTVIDSIPVRLTDETRKYFQ